MRARVSSRKTVSLVSLGSLVLAFVAWGASPPSSAASEEQVDPVALAEVVRWVLGPDAAVPSSSSADEAWLARLPDPDPSTPSNELIEALVRRTALADAAGWTPLDDRYRLLFLRGAPAERLEVDCAETFQPLELWTYSGRTLLLVQPRSHQVHRLWLPLDGKAGLYVREMEFWLRQWHGFGRRISGTRFDRYLCPESEQVDRLTGTDGLLGSHRYKPPTEEELGAYLLPPADLGAWARGVLAEPAPTPVPRLAVTVDPPEFIAVDGPRIRARFAVTVPPEAELEVFEDPATQRKASRLLVAGTIEHGGKVLETVRARYELPTGEGPREAASLVFERSFRPGLDYVARIDVVDDVGGGRLRVVIPFQVPREPTATVRDLAASAANAVFEGAAQNRIGVDSLLLLPAGEEITFGRYRAEAVVTGGRIVRVAFSVDGKVQLTRRAPPYTVELDLPAVPEPLVVRAEGFDAAGALVAHDEIVLNQPRGELEVSIVEPARGVSPKGRFVAAIELVVPEERRVAHVDVGLAGGPATRLERPPWRLEIEMPTEGELVWLTATATLDDGSRAEDTRFLRVPDGFDQVDVRLVELYATVSSRDRSLVRGLEVDDFRVREDGRPQAIAKFELVEDLPLTVGVTLDASGSMNATLGQAQRAATEFLERVLRPTDRAFGVGFATRPALLMQRTSDVGAVGLALSDLAAEGSTALHDAIVFSLYYFRGVEGRKVLVLLSDGDDTSSQLEYRDALAYARRSGVVIYTIGLKNKFLNRSARAKLAELAALTGGRSFLIDKAEELRSVYAEIEAELRSQYLLAYSPDRPPSPEFRKVEVDVSKPGVTVRTIPGYLP